MMVPGLPVRHQTLYILTRKKNLLLQLRCAGMICRHCCSTSYRVPCYTYMLTTYIMTPLSTTWYTSYMEMFSHPRFWTRFFSCFCLDGFWPFLASSYSCTLGCTLGTTAPSSRVRDHALQKPETSRRAHFGTFPAHFFTGKGGQF